jgi:HAMP domain-containing protein
MLELIRGKLALKVSIALALITTPPMVAAAYFITSRETAKMESLTFESARLAASTGAKMYGNALEIGVDSGVLSVTDLFDPVYEEIKGFDFEQPRYHTKYDFYTDRVAISFQDQILASSSDFLYAGGTDVNGYQPTHDSRYIQPLTNDKAKDLAGFRTKRRWTDAVGTAAAKNVEPVLLQSYKRDTGETTWDVSSPIFVKGRHWGAFRVGVSTTALAAQERALHYELIGVFGSLAIIIVGFIFSMLRRSMRPLEQLAGVANDISTGEGLDRPIKQATNDEIGQMAKSLNRLRASLQAAMGRLGE